jgi:hypothetical protein
VFRPLGHPDPARRTRRRILVAALVLITGGVTAVTWTGWQASRLTGVVEQLRADGERLQAQLKASDLIGAAAAETRLRQEADQALRSPPGHDGPSLLAARRQGRRAVPAITTE